MSRLGLAAALLLLRMTSFATGAIGRLAPLRLGPARAIRRTLFIRHPLVARIYGMAAIVVCCVTLASLRGAETWQQLEITVTVRDETSDESRVTEWPTADAVRVSPPNAVVENLVRSDLALLKENEDATALENEPLLDSIPTPHRGQTATDFLNKLRIRLHDRGFSFGPEDPGEEAAPRKRKYAIAFSFEAPTDRADRFEVWVWTNLIPAGAAARRWLMRDLASSSAVQALMRKARADSSQQGSDFAELPSSFALVALPRGANSQPLEVHDQTQIPEEFLPVAVAALEVGREAQAIRVLERPRTASDRAELRPSLERAWDKAAPRTFQSANFELHSESDAAGRPGTPAWVAMVHNLNAVERHRVEISAVHIPPGGTRVWQEFAAAEKAAGTNLEKLEGQRTERTRALFDLLDRERPLRARQFATAEMLAERVAVLRAEPDIVDAAGSVEGETMNFAVTWHPIVTTLEANGSYDSEEGAKGSLRWSTRVARGSVALEAFATERRRGAYFDAMTTPKATLAHPNRVHSWGLVGDLARESPALFGLPERLALKHQTGRVAWRTLLEADLTAKEPQDDRKDPPDKVVVAHSRRWRAEGLLGWRSAKLSSPQVRFLDQANAEGIFGQAQLTFESEVRRRRNGRTLPRESFTAATVTLDASPAHEGADSFGRAELSLLREKRLGTGRWADSLGRISGALGVASRGTPVPWWFRLGGDERMRGFELGELAGRSYSHVGVEAGPNLGAFLKPPSDDAGKDTPAIDPRQILLLFGAEHAWLEDAPRVDPRQPTVNRAASYSVAASYAADLPGLPAGGRLALGYGYAPRAAASRGRFFVNIRVPIPTQKRD